MARDLALVTGANGGIGSAVLAHLSSLGYDVVATDVQHESNREADAYFEADITDQESVERLHGRVLEACGRTPDVLCNIAGILERNPHLGAGTEAFRRVLDVNLWGTYLMIHQFTPSMMQRRYGRVINTASIAGVTGYPFAGYSASKFGVVGLTKALVHDFWGSGVTVNAVCPGAVRTPMMNSQIVDLIEARTPAGAVIEPVEIAPVFGFLASRDARNLTGQTLIVDGGATSAFRFDR
jgi:NAD(P)-dependent dehydrogenase (short-subunit alcohol dehydrogenase family)